MPKAKPKTKSKNKNKKNAKDVSQEQEKEVNPMEDIFTTMLTDDLITSKQRELTLQTPILQL